MIEENVLRRTGKEGREYKTPVIRLTDIPDNEPLEFTALFDNTSGRYPGYNLKFKAATGRGVEEISTNLSVNVGKPNFDRMGLNVGEKFYTKGVKVGLGETKNFIRADGKNNGAVGGNIITSNNNTQATNSQENGGTDTSLAPPPISPPTIQKSVKLTVAEEDAIKFFITALKGNPQLQQWVDVIANDVSKVLELMHQCGMPKNYQPEDPRLELVRDAIRGQL